MKKISGIEVLEISAQVMGAIDTIYPTLIWEEDTVILIDTGFPGLLTKFQKAFEQVGVPFDKLSQIIITHQDLDHIGSLQNILDVSSRNIEVLTSEVEKPYIQGEKRLVKLTDEEIAEFDASFPAEVPEEIRKSMKALFENPPKATIDKTINGGEELSYCGGIIVIDTPGHSPGHISLYHKESKTLIAGDAMCVENGQLRGPRYNFDDELAIKSLKGLVQYDIETVICYHGGIYSGNANQRIAELANVKSMEVL